MFSLKIKTIFLNMDGSTSTVQAQQLNKWDYVRRLSLYHSYVKEKGKNWDSVSFGAYGSGVTAISLIMDLRIVSPFSMILE